MNSPVSAAVLQSELTLEDPRREVESSGVIDDLREFVRASRELRGLLTVGQAARILNCDPSAINVWIRRGRLQCREIVGVRMVSAAEILVMHRQRLSEERQSGGRGHKAPSLAAMAAEAWRDIDPLA